MARFSVSRGGTIGNDFGGVAEVARDPVIRENLLRLFFETATLGPTTLELRGFNLRTGSRGNPDGVVTSLAYVVDGQDVLKIEDFRLTLGRLAEQLATAVGYDFLLSGDDAFVGSNFADRLWGFSGADDMRGGFGEDTLDAGAGADVVYGGGGGDDLFGGPGGDLIFGGPGADVVVGDSVGAGRIPRRADGDDTIYGEGGRDELSGEGGDDFLHGGGSRDQLNGGAGDDTLIGDRGKDKLFGGEGDDSLNGGATHDGLEGGAGDDMLQGAKGGDSLFAGVGDDTLQGGRGLDHLYGGDGADLFVFRRGDGNDRAHDFKPGEDVIDLSRVREISDFEDLVAHHVDETSGGAMIFFKGGSIRLLGVDADALSDDDFIF